MDHLHRDKPFKIRYFCDYAMLKSLLLIQFSFFWIANSLFYLAYKAKAWNH